MKNLDVKRAFKLFGILAVIVVPLSPFAIGVIEARMNLDLIKIGRCRIDNTLAILATKDRATRIVLGSIYADGRKYNHTWGIDAGGRVVDVTCTGAVKRCTLEIIDPWKVTVPVVMDRTASSAEKITVAWNRAYVVAFAAGSRMR